MLTLKIKAFQIKVKKFFDLNTFSFFMPFLKNITKYDFKLKSLIKLKKVNFKVLIFSS